jgi:hypothetical protein
MIKTSAVAKCSCDSMPGRLKENAKSVVKLFLKDVDVVDVAESSVMWWG